MFKFLESLSHRAMIIIAVFALVAFAIGAVAAYKFYDYTQNNPKFCVSCHLMKPSFDAWDKSEHKGINCHECHHLSIPDQNRLLISFILNNPKTVPERHGKVVVPYKYCIKCHWEINEKHPDAPLIVNSPFHSKHFFEQRIECSKCHGYITHRFTPEERFCLKCHEDKNVHGTGMEALACLNCHTERTDNLLPDKKKCLFCHGGDDVRKELIASGSSDVIAHQPSEEVIKKASKINIPLNSAMQFNCFECHKPHKMARPDWNDCTRCHANVKDAPRHSLHIQSLNMKCKDCHKPHVWKVTKEFARKACAKCHEYRNPERFIKQATGK